MSNLRIWEPFCRTDSAATKSYNKSGFNGTDINPTYRLRCLTELFGPQGVGWGWTIHSRWREVWPSRFKGDGGWVDYDAHCAFVELSLWYMDGDKRCEASPQIGGTECDLSPDEVWKMSITDAIGKCCVALGIAADVYMGQFDGKYRETQQREQAPRLPACPKCGESKGVIVGKEEYGGGFVCFAKKGGCGHKWQAPVAETVAAKTQTAAKYVEPPKAETKPAEPPPDPYAKAKAAIADSLTLERLGVILARTDEHPDLDADQKNALLMQIDAKAPTLTEAFAGERAELLGKLATVQEKYGHTFA